MNLSGGTSRDCILTIGRPLDEVVRVTVEFSSLDCTRSGWLMNNCDAHANANANAKTS